MTGLERVTNALAHRESDRIPIYDEPWSSTVDRWRAEGLPSGVSPDDYFGYELTSIGANFSPRFPVKVLERTSECIVETTDYGGIQRNFNDHSTTPEVIERPVKSKTDWEKIKPRLAPDMTRVDWVTGFNTAERATADGKFFTYNAAVGYDHAQSYMKSQDLLIAMVEEPDFVRDIFKTLAEQVVAMAKLMMEKGLRFDGAFLFNDMGYRNASLFSPHTYRELIFEYDKMMCDFFHSKGMPVLLHSCGNVKELIPHLIEAGFDCLHPLEVKAGMDLVELKRQYGDRMAFIGGIDARAMASKNPADIEREISTKIPAAMKGGGYIYHSDDSVPKNVSFQQYKRVIELVKQYGTY